MDNKWGSRGFADVDEEAILVSLVRFVCVCV